MGRTFSFSLSDPTEAPGFDYGEEEVTSSWVRSEINSGDAYDDAAGFGFPRVCLCGNDVIIEASNTATNPGRRFFTCPARDDGECHVWKWWDVAVMEEFRIVQNNSKRIEEKMDSMIEEKMNAMSVLENLVKKRSVEIDVMKKTIKMGFITLLGLLVGVVVAYKLEGL